MAHLARQYELLQPTIDYLRARVPSVVAAWDDHDYGENDSGGDLPYKHESKELFLQAWRPSLEPNESPPSTDVLYSDGIYTAYEYPLADGDVGMVQLLLLDTRFNRSPLKGDPMKGKAVPNYDHGASILGETQFRWLESRLASAARGMFDVTIIASPTQVLRQYNGQESFANFPADQERLVRLIESTGAKNVVLVSGDVHYGELSVWDPYNLPGPRPLDPEDKYAAPESPQPADVRDLVRTLSAPLYDLTSSGISEVWDGTHENMYREGRPLLSRNFGVVEVVAGEDGQPSELVLQLRDEGGELALERRVPLAL